MEFEPDKIPENKYLKLADPSQQDRMTPEGLLKLQDGTYVNLYSAVYNMGNVRRMISAFALLCGQNHLQEREIRFNCGEYVPLEKIVGVCSLEQLAGEEHEELAQLMFGLYGKMGHSCTKIFHGD